MSNLNGCYQEDRAILLPANVGSVNLGLVTHAVHFLLASLLVVGVCTYTCTPVITLFVMIR